MSATQLSGYRLMWIFVMFDLPVTTREQARAATKFREFLLDEGFEKSQFSVYARFCNGKEQFEPICGGWKQACRIAATSTSSASRTANMKISCDFQDRSDAGSEKIQISWRYSDDSRDFILADRRIFALRFNAVSTDPS